ncbi:hypothetical protein HPP92_008014 [Vanilla planifolia]|uniref:polynucleotide adenylyltransferase n=1 Tax=Vanilla planifolia TaxID=51239 RepID=A0A835V9A1_VANPL|nr:hypothetical protein HPP92_008014 [Vanilla planifolia]
MEDADATVSYIYETLDPISVSEESVADDSESYAIFRRQITSSIVLTADIPVADYFSLDVSDESTTRCLDEPQIPTSVSSAVTVCSPEGAPAATFETAWFRARSRFKSPMLQLHKEILDFSEFVSPTPEEQDKRTAAVNHVFEVVKYIWPHCRVEVFGSFRTGLYLPTSDIDAMILDSKVKRPQTGLYALARALSQRGIAKKMQVIAKARVPIVKFVEKKSGIAFDISFDMDSGPKAADFIKEVVEKIPPLKPLCLILKVFLHHRELNEVYTGGIGSYALLAMLIAHLQIHQKSDMQVVKNSMEGNLGILFVQAPENDIGKNSFNYYKVKSAFAMAYSSLTDVRTIMSLGSHKSILGTIIRPDPVLLLHRKGGSNGQLTFNYLLPGASESSLQRCSSNADAIYNWQLLDDEPFPRGSTPKRDEDSSTRKRTTFTEKERYIELNKLRNSGNVERIGFWSEGCVKKRRFKDRDDQAKTSSHHYFR